MGELQGQLAVLIERGGVVMLLLLALSVVSLTLIVERAWFWLTVHRPGRLKLIRALNSLLRAGDGAAARGLVEGDRSPYGAVARQLLEQGCGDAVAVEAVESVRPRLDRFMVSLSTIVTAAPLLGILGTVFGIIQSFQLLGEGVGALSDPSAVSAGIAEALLTTAMGLVVALVTLFPYMIFRGQLERSIGRLESVIAAAQQGGGEPSKGRSANDAQMERPKQESAAPGRTGSAPVTSRSR